MPDAPDALALEDVGTVRGDALFLRAAAVAWDGRGLLILGASGAGKSTLALGVLAHNGHLIADDGVLVSVAADGLSLAAPESHPDLIEARFVGLLAAPLRRTGTPLALVVDLDSREDARLPPHRRAVWRGHHIDLIRAQGHPDLTPVLVHYLRFGRGGEDDAR